MAVMRAGASMMAAFGVEQIRRHLTAYGPDKKIHIRRSILKYPDGAFPGLQNSVQYKEFCKNIYIIGIFQNTTPAGLPLTH